MRAISVKNYTDSYRGMGMGFFSDSGSRLGRGVLIAALLLVFLIGSPRLVIADGVWSGVSYTSTVALCPGDRRKIKGTMSDGNFNGILLDGWEREFRISGAVDGNGRFVSNSFMWPHYQSGWTQVPSPSESRVVGVFKGNTFQGIVYALAGGKSCDTVIYMQSGSSHRNVFSIKDEIHRGGREVLEFDEMHRHYVVNYSASTNSSQFQSNQESLSSTGQNTATAMSSESVIEKLKFIKKLHDDGLISAEEAERKRADILDAY